MRLIVPVKLLPTEEQHGALVDTLTTTNEACNYISQHAWDKRTFRQYDLHKAIYYEVRERFSLSAQMTVRAIAKVADAYKKDRQRKHTFKTVGGVAYDDRILSYNLDRSTVSIWTTQGRLTIPFTCGPLQKALLNSQRGESDLILFKGDFYLLATCDVDEPTPKAIEGILGVDLGIVNVAAGAL